MKTSLIITTYKRPDALELVLKSVLEQKVLPDEILVADDGSGEATRLVVKGLVGTCPIPLIHCWQQDKGFRLARVRNLAIAKSTGDYLIMVDGDMLLNKYFVHDHIEFSKAGFFVQGSRVLLSENKTADIIRQPRKLGFFSGGISNRLNTVRSAVGRYLLSGKKKSHIGVRGCNMAFWKEDAEKVNGFNEEFVGWGREDSEFVVRLFNNGIFRRNLKFGAVAFHLFHGTDNQDSTAGFLEENETLLIKTIERKLRRCYFGLDRHNAIVEDA